MITNPAEKMKKLVSEYENKKINMEQLDVECAYWYLDCFGEIRLKAEPSPPNRLIDYRSMPFDRKIKVPQEFWHNPEIKSYLEQKDSVKQENVATLAHLKKWMSIIPESDFVARQKFREKINDFESKDYC